METMLLTCIIIFFGSNTIIDRDQSEHKSNLLKIAETLVIKLG